MKLSGFATNDYVLLGSFVRLAGFQATMPKDGRNKRAAIIRVDYFNGSDVGSANRYPGRHVEYGRSFWQSGTVTWTPPAATSEFKTCVNNDMELYYYRLHWSASLSASGVLVDKVVGVPHPVMLTGHTRAFVAQDRLFLVKDNRLECSPVSRPTVMNGSEHVEFAMGDESEITGGCHLFTIQGSEYYSPILVFKKTATYLLTGSGPSWQRHELSRYDGLAAPDTLCVVNLPISIPGMGTTIAVGQGTTGVFICDGQAAAHCEQGHRTVFRSPPRRLYPAGHDRQIGGLHGLRTPGISLAVYERRRAHIQGNGSQSAHHGMVRDCAGEITRCAPVFP